LDVALLEWKGILSLENGSEGFFAESEARLDYPK